MIWRKNSLQPQGTANAKAFRQNIVRVRERESRLVSLIRKRLVQKDAGEVNRSYVTG